MLKATVRHITPPALWQALHRWRHGPKRYRRWAAACAAAGRYECAELTRFRIARDTETPPPIDPHHPLAMAIARLVEAPMVTVTDFGGGTGTTIRSAILRFPQIRGVVIEHAAMVQAVPARDGIRWTGQIPEKCDVFFTGGTIQYLADPYAPLRQGFASAAHAVVLTRNCFCPQRIIRLQHERLFNHGHGPIPPGFNDRPILLPHQTVDETRVLQIAQRHGFRLIWEAPDSSGVQPYFGKVYGKQMLFWRDPR